MLTDELRYRLMRLVDANPDMSQRDWARQLAVSVGKINSCVQALIRTGWISALRSKNRQNKNAYLYFLTRRGAEEKVRLNAKFLELKMLEYDSLRSEIEQMRQEAERDL